MTTRLFAMLAIALFGAALVSPLAAQTLVLKANVPFDFNFAGKTMPAGEYLVQTSASTAMLTLRNYDADSGAMGLGSPISAHTSQPAGATIIFNRYGGTYFLSSVVIGSSGAGVQFRMTPAERELAQTASAQKFEVLAATARL